MESVVMGYTEAFKAQMVRKMIGPPARSATSLAAEVGVSQAQLCRWRQKSIKNAGMSIESPDQPPVTKKWTPAEKFRVLVKAEGLSGEELGALLRQEGLHEVELRGWREAAAGALSAEAASSGASSLEERRATAEARKRVKELEGELRRKEKALAEAAALLLLEKKLQDLGLVGAGPSTSERNEE